MKYPPIPPPALKGRFKTMPQSLARLCVHLVFSTKHREPFLQDSIRKDLHAYMATVLKNMECPALIINSVEDHIHILLDLGRTISVSYVMEHAKKTSSKWLKTQNQTLYARTFGNQSMFGTENLCSKKLYHHERLAQPVL
jgi:hypothetical protein